MRAAIGDGRRAGFTTIELVVVISIAMALLSMGAPSVMVVLQRSGTARAANEVAQCWRVAQGLAVVHAEPAALPGESAPRHYGILLRQLPGKPMTAAVVYDWQTSAAVLADPARAALRVDRDGAAAGNPAVRLVTLPDQVLAEGIDENGAAFAGAIGLVVYAQYRTGLPIAAARVAAGSAITAPVVGVGVPGGTGCRALRLRHGLRGTAIAVALYQVGIVALGEQ